MHVVSVNVAQVETLHHGGRDFVTGISKRPVMVAAHFGEQGVADDVIVDQENHGGADQAVYVYAASDYEWWSEQLDIPLPYGTFGENLTIDTLPHDMNTGDRLLIGDVLLEVTAPRIPCSTLAAKMQDSSFGLKFRRAERPGYYCRVLNEGPVSNGAGVTLVENPADGISILEQFRLAYESSPDAAALRRALAAPLAERMRKKFQSRLDAFERARQ